MVVLNFTVLKIYSFNPLDKDLQNIKKMLSDYFANKLINDVDEAVNKNKISEETIESWLSE